ncbi:PE-PPE domain-containing protein [Mycobacterium camsae]|uniref:PE-PPE domain-containing protein n=1 Tax=Mycobacterium gordonae TaxID=1778 RepID=UPI00197DC745|nr:PE-PPE domain-containing protein [Mycobacterium gordonae]
MSFAVLPPELNSTRMCTGVGRAPMLAAAAAWDGLAQELEAAAGSVASATFGLAGEAWQGDALQAMTRAAGPYVGWLSVAASQAEQTAAQARLAADAFDAARAAIVHPAVIAANRSQLVSLVRSNLLGLNTPTIAAVEADYEQIWAQDVAAMACYHANASAATQLPQWQQLAQNLREQVASAYAAAGLPVISVNMENGTFNVGSANTGINNIGFGNNGNGNIGVANTGNENIGFHNLGSRNFGLGNQGNGNIGIGLTGNGQIGFGIPDDDYPHALVVGDGGPGVTALVIGGTKSPLPLPRPAILEYAAHFITPFHLGYTAEYLKTPSEFFPLTGPGSLTFDASVAQGVVNLHAEITEQLAAGNHVIVFGGSQGAAIALMEIRYLHSLSENLRPGLDELSFVLTGNPFRPDGGLFARGLAIPQLGISFSGATPSVYPLVDYAVQYDGVADFPRYPLNLISTANAVAGIVFLHSGLMTVPHDLAAGIVQPVSSPDVHATYILLPTEDLPLLYPLRAIPLVGNPLADLVQPDLRVLVELGYDRTAYQDVLAPFGLFPHVDPALLAAQLHQGAVQGVHDALASLGVPPKL